MKCQDCKYYESQGNAGFCHKFPPENDGKGIATVDEFPVVKEADWCGEYKKKGAK